MTKFESISRAGRTSPGTRNIVAQIFNLPYRRLAACRASPTSNALAKPAHCRFQIGDTAETASLRYGAAAVMPAKGAVGVWQLDGIYLRPASDFGLRVSSDFGICESAMLHSPEFTPVCPIPFSNTRDVLMAHGGGGKLMHPSGERYSSPRSATLRSTPVTTRRFWIHRTHCFTTDSYVVRPLFSPGGDIGSLAVLAR